MLLSSELYLNMQKTNCYRVTPGMHVQGTIRITPRPYLRNLGANVEYTEVLVTQEEELFLSTLNVCATDPTFNLSVIMGLVHRAGWPSFYK